MKNQNIEPSDQKKIINILEYFENALATLRSVFLKMSQTPQDDDNFIFFRDSFLRRFTYSFDMFWKLLREFIIEKHGIEVVASPKAVLKQAFDLYVINEMQYKTLLISVNDRNLTSHAYHENIAEEIASHVQNYYQLMHNIADRLKADLLQ